MRACQVIFSGHIPFIYLVSLQVFAWQQFEYGKSFNAFAGLFHPAQKGLFIAERATFTHQVLQPSGVLYTVFDLSLFEGTIEPQRIGDQFHTFGILVTLAVLRVTYNRESDHVKMAAYLV